jgi:hypothetical protein
MDFNMALLTVVVGNFMTCLFRTVLPDGAGGEEPRCLD